MTATVAPIEISDDQGDPLRLLPISVNLMPAEVVAARQGRQARRATAALLLAVAVATGGWYYTARQATSDASAQLAQARRDAAAARGNQNFAPLTSTKAKIAGLEGGVRQVTTGDVAWNRLYPAIRSIAPKGLTLTGLAGTAVVSTQTAGAAPATGTSATSGSLVITGSAPTKPTVSVFMNRLTTVDGLVDPLVTSIATDSQTKKLTFSIQVTTTTKALSTRYAKAVK